MFGQYSDYDSEYDFESSDESDESDGMTLERNVYNN